MSGIMRAYRYRIYPKKWQIEILEKSFWAKRFVWNHFLEINMDRFEKNEGILSYNKMSSMLTDLKKNNDWLYECEKSVMQNTLKDLVKAYDYFFDGPMTYSEKKLEKAKRTGKVLTFYDLQRHPKFKSRYDYEQSFVMNLTNNNIEVLEKEWEYTSTNKYKKQNCKIKLPKIKMVKLAYSRPYEGQIKNVAITRESDEKYYISITCKDVPTKLLPKTHKSVGIDLGVHKFAILSDKNVIDNPKYFQKNEKKLAKLQRSMDLKKKHGKNYNKSRLKVSRQNKKIKHRREDFLHKLTTDFVYDYDLICIEDLKPEEMKKNKMFAKSVSDAAYSTFRTFLQYKMGPVHKQLIVIDQYYPSSQICHKCDYQDKRLKDVSVRKWTCQVCGTKHDRDENASINIEHEGLRGLKEGIYKSIA
ncbi:IS200/IS605 family element transposase accessory protein TnpB [Acidaminobacter sp. JC074]|uniref:transposase n=1 Tax=Acidaminobacter sp. JC074 TaxID=2530199 RepID=UPI001F0F08EC|nr:transposase [Acidaminobacter sp. JC074]MCH4890939.1 IS200/IS605 family element transposase accessory protein TnpB [Acidaminobacter sp. JC074]